MCRSLVEAPYEQRQKGGPFFRERLRCWRTSRRRFSQSDARALRCRSRNESSYRRCERAHLLVSDIFDYPVMDQGQLATGIEMRMRVFVVHLAVRGPTRVADAQRA